MGSIPGSGKSPGVGNGNPLHYPCLRNPMERGAWVHKESGMIEPLSTQTHTYVVLVTRASPGLICAVFHGPATTGAYILKNFYINGGGFVLNHHTYSLIEHWTKIF